MVKNWETEGEFLLFLASGHCSGCRLARAQAGSQHKLEIIEREKSQPVTQGGLHGPLNATVAPSGH